MTGTRILIVAVSLVTLISSSCTKEEETPTCQWFPAKLDSVYTRITQEGSSEYKPETTDKSVNFNGTVFESNDCESVTVSVNGGAKIPARERYLGTAKLFDETIGDIAYLSYQSDTVKPLALNGFTYHNAMQGLVSYKHKSGYPQGNITYWFGENLGILSVNMISKQHADSPTVNTTYELK